MPASAKGDYRMEGQDQRKTENIGESVQPLLRSAIPLAVLISFYLIPKIARSSEQARELFWIISFPLFVSPLSFAVGRSAYWGESGWKKGWSLFLVMECVILSLFFGGIRVVCGLAIGVAVFFAAGLIAEAVSYARTGGPSGERVSASAAYLRTLDEHTRNGLLGVGVASFIIGFTSVIGGAMLLAEISRHLSIARLVFVRPLDNVLYFVPRDPGIRILPVVSLLFIAVGRIIALLAPRIAGKAREQWLEYVRLMDAGMSKSVRTARRVAFYAFTAAMIAALWLYIGDYAKFGEEGVSINTFWGFGEKHYRWSAVQSISTAEESVISISGQDERRSVVRIRFSDGYVWSPSITNAERRRTIGTVLRYISEESDRPVDRQAGEGTL